MIIKTYKQLNTYVSAFSKESINLLIVKSVGGLGKSYTVQNALKRNENVLFFNGHATPLSIYLRLLQNPDSLVVFDDVDSLLSNKTGVALLKQVCEIKPNKSIRYDTTSKINGEDVPASFTSNNKVIILCNDLKRIGKNIGALWTRGILIEFLPCKLEVMKTIKNINGLDVVIFRILQKYLLNIKNVNVRLYLKLVELKTAGIDWFVYLKSEFNTNQERELALEIMDLSKDKRNEIWISKTGKTVRSLQRLIKCLKKELKE